MKIRQMSLRARIFFILGVLVFISLAGGTVTMLLLDRISRLVTSVVEVNVTALTTAQELESSLSAQKGLLTYYYVDSNHEWLDQIEQHETAFQEWLGKARDSAFTREQRDILNEIESRYVRYSYVRDKVIDLYKSGEKTAGIPLHREARAHFLAIRDLCETFKKLQHDSISLARADIRSHVRGFDVMALAAMPGTLGLGVLLFYLVFHRVLEPVRKLAMGRDDGGSGLQVMDEVKALGYRVRSLMEDVDQTQTQLQLSREHLVQSEKLALVGKLAAGVAHSVRNPLTSVKMRLFSLERSLDLSPTQREDMEVISEEISHIDTIVRNFLEFSRRPKLKIQRISPSDVVDMAVQLLRHRIESYGVEVELYRDRRLSRIEGDPEQLKEVFVNLIVNACDAMGDGGKIVISEEEGLSEPMGHVVVIRISDSGPGVPESLRDKVFQPFFSTKEEGTGLGLSIATRIIEDHQGCLSLRSREGKGATFVITLPCREDGAWLRSL